MNRPRIAIPEIDQDMINYTKAVQAAGMEPVVISVSSEQIQVPQEYLDYSEFRVENFDGLLLPGGWDIDPARYGRENKGSVHIMKDLDDLQLSIMDEFVKAGKPVLGICRGHQLINVYFGGTLIQHLETSFRHARGDDAQDKIHGCVAEEGSWLEQLYGTEFVHNSAHHQAVELPGKGLVIDSRCAEDGTVEAMHHETLPVYSVQWHPERLSLDWAREDAVNGIKIFEYFCRLADRI